MSHKDDEEEEIIPSRAMPRHLAVIFLLVLAFLMLGPRLPDPVQVLAERIAAERVAQECGK